MSRPRSRSPRYRRFPWEEPDFDPYKVLAELDGDQMDRSHYHREDHLDYLREELYPVGQRRSPPLSDDHHFVHQRHPNQEEFYRRRPSPHHDMMSYDDRRLSQTRDREGDGDRYREGFREHVQSCENRRWSPHSPLRLERESLPSTPRSYSDHQQREPGMGWRREEQERGRGRFRDLNPSIRSEDHRGGAERERERRNTQGSHRERRREDSHQERTPPSRRQRRDMDDGSHPGYRNEEDFGEQRYSVDVPRDGFEGHAQGIIQPLAPLVIEHDHGMTLNRESARWEHLDYCRDLDPDFDRQGSPHPLSSFQERFRTSDSRLDDREDHRGRNIQDNWRDTNYHETRRSPTLQERPNPMRYGNQDGPVNHRGRAGSRSGRGQFSRSQGGRSGPHRNQNRLPPSSQGYQDLAPEEQRPGSRPLREGFLEDSITGEADWAEETRLQQWKHDRPGSLDRHPPNIDLDPKMPRQRMREWNDQTTNNMTVVTEETLTIKVDMSRPVNQNSSLCYSSDRQLSLDLVNVGRQRLDFLPMLEHSGTYRETATHTGTFAQEIITLVHHVKEQYFKGDGITLNERFSAPQKGGYSEDETEELTLDERFSSTRGFSLNMSSLLDDDKPLFSRLGPLQLMRGPGDLRHDLERRRQERLEGVKVTISGNSVLQHPPSPASERGLEYSDRDMTEDEGFTSWPEEQSRRRDGNMGPRRGAPYRLNSGPQRRNNRFSNRGGPMRRQNNRKNNSASVTAPFRLGSDSRRKPSPTESVPVPSPIRCSAEEQDSREHEIMVNYKLAGIRVGFGKS